MRFELVLESVDETRAVFGIAEIVEHNHQIIEAELGQKAVQRQQYFDIGLRRGSADELDADWDRMVTFYRFPRSQWKCLRTTNPLENVNGAFKRRTNSLLTARALAMSSP